MHDIVHFLRQLSISPSQGTQTNIENVTKLYERRQTLYTSCAPVSTREANQFMVEQRSRITKV